MTEIDADIMEKVARAMMDVRAAIPGGDGTEYPILDMDPDFDDLPRDHTEGTMDDPITQEGVLKLSRAAIAAYEAAKDKTHPETDSNFRARIQPLAESFDRQEVHLAIGHSLDAMGARYGLSRDEPTPDRVPDDFTRALRDRADQLSSRARNDLLAHNEQQTYLSCAATIEEQNALIKELCEALEPFANVANHDVSDDQDSDSIYRASVHHSVDKILIGDLRRARAVLERVKG